MGDDKKNTSILKLVFTDIDYKHTIIEDLCYEFNIDYDTYYEDDFSNRTTITPTRVDKVFWNKVYELEIPTDNQGIFASHLINKYIEQIKTLELLFTNNGVTEDE